MIRALFVFAICGAASAIAQTTHGERLPVPGVPPEQISGPFGRYRSFTMGTLSFTDSPRLDSLIRSGNLYLGLKDAISLAIENNLDVEYQRVTPRIAEADLLRTKGGAVARGIPSNVTEGPIGLGSSGGPLQSGITGGAAAAASRTDTNNLTQGTSVPAAGPAASASGPALPNLDPAIVGSLGRTSTNRPQTNTFITGTNQLTTNSNLGELSVQKGFLFGGTASVGFDMLRQDTNNARSDINPASTGGLAASFTQPLLRGLGIAVNSRYIRIANNNRQVSDLVFEQQVINTVYTVTRLYWDLVSLYGESQVQRQSLALAERLLNENVQQEQAGTLAPIEVVRARAQVASARRDLTIAETRMRQQGNVLKDYVVRGSVDSQALSALRVIPTDSALLPTAETIRPLQDLMQDARAHRPELRQTEIQIENSQIAITGSRNALLPGLDLVASARSNALFGHVSTLPPTPGSGTAIRQPDPAFLGGLGTGLGQLFGLNFPDYTVQLQLSIPILNRVARADYARDQLALRQQQIRSQQLLKQVAVEVVNALTAVEQSRSAYEASQEARQFQEQSLEAERQKYAVGASTNYLVIQYQRDLAVAQSAEVSALADYSKAKAALDRATGGLLDRYNVSIAEAYQGRVKD